MKTSAGPFINGYLVSFVSEFADDDHALVLQSTAFAEKLKELKSKAQRENLKLGTVKLTNLEMTDRQVTNIDLLVQEPKKITSIDDFSI